jgi:hypothetical protein
VFSVIRGGPKTTFAIIRALSAFLLLFVCAAPGRIAATQSDPDPVRAWNERALQTVRTVRLSDAQAARLYAMVNVAMYDAVNGIITRHGTNAGRGHALVPGDSAPPQDLHAAAAAAAHAVLIGEHAALADAYNEQLANDLSALGHGGAVTAGQEWGAQVGAQVRTLRTGDGSTPNESQPGSGAPGHFRVSWSGSSFAT